MGTTVADRITETLDTAITVTWPGEGHVPDDAVERIAIVGIACRVPGADDVAAFWRNLLDGVESLERVATPARAPEGHVPVVGRLTGIEQFDAGLFGMTPREAAQTDPQHRLFLELCWQALHDAATDPDRPPGRIGVWGGCGMNTYLLLNLLPHLSHADLLREYPAGLLHGNDKDYLASRVAYKLGLDGPAVAVQTACSSSLVAVAQAAQSLLDYQCDVALAGGASVTVPQDWGYVYEKGGILSPDGHCRPFDAAASGTVFGSGAGVVVLKRMTDAIADRDQIYAVIRGTAVNSDGSRRVGFTAPSVDGQAEVITDAYRAADVGPGSIGYVEAHGTGTAVGDPIELAALDEVYARAGVRTGSVPIGSVKSNIGHLNAAAGVIGLIKAVLAVRHGQIPATLHYRRPNPRVRPDSAFAVVDRTLPWLGNGPRRAAVSSFGVGGTNAHLVIEQAMATGDPARDDSARDDWARDDSARDDSARDDWARDDSARDDSARDDSAQDYPARRTAALTVDDTRSTGSYHVLGVSAHSDPATRAATAALAEVLASPAAPDLADVAATLHRRRRFAHRVAVVCADPADGSALLAAAEPSQTRDNVTVAFLFPGQGSQFRGMAAGLARSRPEFADRLAECLSILDPLLGVDLTDLLVHPGPPGDADPLVNTALAQPALFAVGYALSCWWQSVGVRPVALLGHSIGEWVSACVSGVIALPDALRLVCARGRLMAGRPPGAMLAVELTEDEAWALCDTQISLAAVNGPDRCVLSGPVPAVSAVEALLRDRDVPVQRLITSHAFHSAMLGDVVEVYADLVAEVELNRPSVPFVSGVTGTWITDAQARDPRYWAEQLRRPVRFGDGLATVMAAGAPVLLEVGPGHTLGRLAALQIGAGAPTVQCIPSPRQRTPGNRSLLGAAARLWQFGVDVDPGALGVGTGRVVTLPGYPFQRTRHWIDPPDIDPHPVPARSLLSGLADLANDVHTAVQDAVAPAIAAVIGQEAPDLCGRVARLWEELLGMPALEASAHLFELGGDSLIATKLVSRANRAFGVDVPLDQFLDDPTIGRMADLVQQSAGADQEVMW